MVLTIWKRWMRNSRSTTFISIVYFCTKVQCMILLQEICLFVLIYSFCFVLFCFAGTCFDASFHSFIFLKIENQFHTLKINNCKLRELIQPKYFVNLNLSCVNFLILQKLYYFHENSSTSANELSHNFCFVLSHIKKKHLIPGQQEQISNTKYTLNI